MIIIALPNEEKSFSEKIFHASINDNNREMRSHKRRYLIESNIKSREMPQIFQALTGSMWKPSKDKEKSNIMKIRTLRAFHIVFIG